MNLDAFIKVVGDALSATGNWAYDSGAALVGYLGGVINTIVGK